MKKEPIEEPPSLLDERDFFESEQQHEGEQPYKELENLITDVKIDVKTILNDKQIVMLHKLETLRYLYTEGGMSESAELIDEFIRRFKVLLINRDGTSRKQFIEGVNAGREKIEEAKRNRLQQLVGNFI